MTSRLLAITLAAALPMMIACGADTSGDANEMLSIDLAPDRHVAPPLIALGESPAARLTPRAIATPPSPAPSPAPSAPPSVIPAGPIPYRGVNLSGGEFGSAIPGTDGIDYRFPTSDEIDHFVAKGMNTFRVGFLWERLQPAANGDLAPAYALHLDELVDHASAKGAFVILDPHNYARYHGVTVGSAGAPNDVFADFWRRLATRYGQNPRVMFNLVNEPHDISSEQWVSAANAAIAAIRAAGATNTIIVPGNAWTGAWSWNDAWYGTPNATAMLAIVDPADKTLFEVHQYLDATSQGSDPACVSGTIGRERLAPFVAWLRANHKRGFLGELGGGDGASCAAAIPDMLAYVAASSDVLDGWLWWAAGPAWGSSYPLSLEPIAGVDRPQMSLLAPFLVR